MYHGPAYPDVMSLLELTNYTVLTEKKVASQAFHVEISLLQCPKLFALNKGTS
jgi:hypothetical protein